MALEPSRFHRSADDRKIAGVCGGLAEQFGLDPTLVRLGFVLFALFGVGELVYIVLWIVLPVASAGESPGAGRA